MAANRQIDASHIIFPTTPVRPKGSPGNGGALLPYKDAKQRFDTEYYSQLMRTAGGNVSLAAKLGQKTRKEVYDALKRLGLDAMAFRSSDD
jgi:DNA-binding NtrC family response regulator